MKNLQNIGIRWKLQWIGQTSEQKHGFSDRIQGPR